MSKSILIFLAGLLTLTLSARTIYLTRHGQISPKVRISNKIKDFPLTELGEKQAQALADYLIKKQQFKGTIYVSPFYRTIQTGTFVSNQLKSKVILEPGIQEIAAGPKPSFAMDLQTINSLFPEQTVAGKRYSDPWRAFNEDEDKRFLRVQKTLTAILAEEKGDILLVAHGGIVGPILKFFNARRAEESVPPVRGRAWNCALYILELDENNKLIKGRYTTEFMADRDLTRNFHAPKIPRPDDPRYETKAQEERKKKRKR